MTYNDFEYKYNGDSGVTIVGYLGDSKHIVIPPSINDEPVIEIGANAFFENTDITSIEIPSSVEKIGNDAFSCYEILKVFITDLAKWCAIEFEDGLKVYELYLNGEIVKNLVVPSEVTSISPLAFHWCDSITSIEIHKEVTSIGQCAFEGCGSLESIIVDTANSRYSSQGNCLIDKSSNELIVGCKNSIIPNCVTSIGEYAFSACESANIDVPSGVTSIGSKAFFNCFKLTSIKIPSSVISIGKTPFFGCDSLESIIVDNDNIKYASKDNCLLDKSTNVLIAGCKSSIIPSGVTSIGADAFSGCKTLTSIDIPSGVTNIGPFAFYCCSELKSVNISNGVTSIGNYAFYGCRSLSSIIIPQNVEYMGTQVFGFCDDLTIYCEAEQKPEQWNKDWNADGYPVVWSYKNN